MPIKYTNWGGTPAPSPVAMELAQKAGVQETPTNYRDFMVSREPSSVAQERMGANTQYTVPERGQFAPNTNYTSVSMTPKFETYAQARQREDDADTKAYQQSHPGLTNDFSAKIAEILRQGRQAEQSYKDSSEGKLPVKTMGQIAEERMSNIPQEQSWRRQNPFTEQMGYKWADDSSLKGLGWGDDDITSMKARTEFDPQEIENLYKIGAIKAPYREYLKEQERLRQEAEQARIAAEQYSYNNDDYSYSEPTYEEPSSASEPMFKGEYSIQAPERVGFDQLDSDSMAPYHRSQIALTTSNRRIR